MGDLDEIARRILRGQQGEFRYGRRPDEFNPAFKGMARKSIDFNRGLGSGVYPAHFRLFHVRHDPLIPRIIHDENRLADLDHLPAVRHPFGNHPADGAGNSGLLKTNIGQLESRLGLLDFGL